MDALWLAQVGYAVQMSRFKDQIWRGENALEPIGSESMSTEENSTLQ